MQNLNLGGVSNEAVLAAETQLAGLTLQGVRVISMGTTVAFEWATEAIYKLKAR